MMRTSDWTSTRTSASAPWSRECLRLGVTHAPYLRVLDAMADDQLDLVFAGHTHGGQLCLPGVGALVTNCDLPRSQARGLHRRGDMWLHVSAGLGTSPTAPVRFACPTRSHTADAFASRLTELPKASNGSVG